jgi:2-oxo-4-hydroxy-4-carboxy-5-ureidoimidazoline decarboxylase
MSISTLLNELDDESARAALERCCGALRWVGEMLARRPFESDAALFAAADEAWSALRRDDVLEAFSHHPRIGADLDRLRERFASTEGWARGEQAGVAGASEAVLEQLRDGNLRYEEKFGFLFIVCATGKSAAEMLALLEARLGNDPERELAVAAAEQAKITRVRLEKLEA